MTSEGTIIGLLPALREKARLPFCGHNLITHQSTESPVVRAIQIEPVESELEELEAACLELHGGRPHMLQVRSASVQENAELPAGGFMYRIIKRLDVTQFELANELIASALGIAALVAFVFIAILSGFALYR